MLKLVLLAPSSISGREREDAAVLEFGQGRPTQQANTVLSDPPLPSVVLWYSPPLILDFLSALQGKDFPVRNKCHTADLFGRQQTKSILHGKQVLIYLLPEEY
ncbi:hypothetical protein Anapl_13395 [Anas platyrhynchos]|uniref:Uncharacterized protein n=1 Tax=Anas platyrhynchos TaxID=8839 RepID=R0JCI8_ANAPL|nr:hypothetical protein Anapl_13395 [Anas platyrhynchos]